MYEDITSEFRMQTILVVGDVMLDIERQGNVTKISPEAPVPVVDIRSEFYSPGGAANTAQNLSSLGASTILLGVIGKDVNGERLRGEIAKRGIENELIYVDRPTTTKERIRDLEHSQQVVRLDTEDRSPIDKKTERELFGRLHNLRLDAIAVSDYAKGLITQDVYRNILEFALEQRIPVLVDPKPKNKIDYSGATVLKLNHREAYELADTQSDDIGEVGRALVDRLKSDIVITRAAKGVMVFRRNGQSYDIPANARQISDVTGAGDTFLAAMTLAYASGASLRDAAHIANVAAGIKVGKLGAVGVGLEELTRELN